jgi:hypothetical protein
MLRLAMRTFPVTPRWVLLKVCLVPGLNQRLSDAVENAAFLWFNAGDLRLNVPLVLFVLEIKGWFRRNLIGEQAINYAIYY